MAHKRHVHETLVSMGVMAHPCAMRCKRPCKQSDYEASLMVGHWHCVCVLHMATQRLKAAPSAMIAHHWLVGSDWRLAAVMAAALARHPI